MKKESTIMTSLAKRAGAVALCATLGMTAFAGTAFAYFTSNTQATGGHPIELGYSSEVQEEITGGNKSITMENTGNSEIMVRVQLFYGNGINGNVTVTEGAEGTAAGWSKDEATGIWSWEGVLAPGQTTDPLIVTVKADDDVDLDEFDVTVIGQTSPVYYDIVDGKEVPVAILWETQN